MLNSTTVEYRQHYNFYLEWKIKTGNPINLGIYLKYESLVALVARTEKHKLEQTNKKIVRFGNFLK